MSTPLDDLLLLEIPTHESSEPGFLEITGTFHLENINSRIMRISWTLTKIQKQPYSLPKTK